VKIGDLGEFGWIRRIERAIGRTGEGVLCGIGDDAALLDVGGDTALVATCDCQIEGVHFRPAWIEPEQLGRRAAAVNLSDLAAMGAVPRWALASLAAPPEAEVERLDRIFEGLASELAREGAALVGGNTARSRDGLIVDLFLLGVVERDRALTRGGAQQGDAVCVTGELGGSGAGLLLLESPESGCDPDARVRAITRHLAPRARIAEGRSLAGSGLVHACIDVSDGLLADAGHLAERSGVSIRIAAEQVPVAAEAAAVARATGRDPLELALAGGEDFELLFTVGESDVDRIIQLLREAHGAAVHRIGTVASGEPGVLVERDGERIDVEGRGFDHFGS